MFYKYFLVFIVSTVKFLVAFPLAFSFRLSFFETLWTTAAGGVAGVLFFVFLTEELIVFWKWLKRKFIYPNPRLTHRLRFLFGDPNKKPTKVSIKKKRKYVKMRKGFGYWGLIVFTPFIISIPIGTFLIIRFFGRSAKNVWLLIVSVIFWSLVFSSLMHFAGIKIGDFS